MMSSSPANPPYVLETLVVKGVAYPHLRLGGGARHLVVIPGLSFKSVLDTPEFIAQAFAEFVPHFTVHLFARRQVLPPGFALPDFAQDLADCLEAARIPVADIFGTSLGGIIAMHLGLRHPELVHSLALVSTTPLLDASTSDLFQSFVPLAETGQTAPLVDALASWVYSPEFRQKNRLAFEGLGLALTPAELAHFAQVVRVMRPFNLTSQLPQIRCPVLVAAAEGDRLFPPSRARLLARLTAATLQLYPASSHAFYDELPAFRSALLAHLLAL
ncbi:MAG: alpha/beta fold hydrolase [Kiritimatiellae bacterium]|nr:alpha/beta fold hydrolase [Kiritimatiellia bacterium]